MATARKQRMLGTVSPICTEVILAPFRLVAEAVVRGCIPEVVLYCVSELEGYVTQKEGKKPK